MAPSLFDCTGLVAVVSGGGSGIGLAMASALAHNGASVYIMGRRQDRLEQVVKEFAAAGASGKILPLQCDVTVKDSLAAAAAKIGEEVGYVNLVIANAGVSGPSSRALLYSKEQLTIQDVQKHLWNFSMEDVLKTYEVNVAAVLFTAVAFLDLLDKGNQARNVEQKSQIVITSSIGSFHRHWQSTGLPYVTSKAAVTHLGKNLAGSFLQWNIRVNCIAPGMFPSELSDALQGSKDDRTIEGSVPKTIVPLGREGRSDEIGGTILYLASRAGAYCSGSVQVVDGGRIGVLPGTTY